MTSEKELKKLKQRMSKLERENSKLKKRLDRRESSKKTSKNHDREISRRSFLKKLGAGAIGLGALSLSPAASRMRLTDNEVLRDGSPAYLDLSGSYSMNSSLDMGNNSVEKVSSLIFRDDGVQSTLRLPSDGTTTYKLRVRDPNQSTNIATFQDYGISADNLQMENTASRIWWKDQGGGSKPFLRGDGNGGIRASNDEGTDTILTSSKGGTVLTTADEGSGNGLDADTLDGNDSSYFAATSDIPSTTFYIFPGDSKGSHSDRWVGPVIPFNFDPSQVSSIDIQGELWMDANFSNGDIEAEIRNIDNGNNHLGEITSTNDNETWNYYSSSCSIPASKGDRLRVYKKTPGNAYPSGVRYMSMTVYF